MSAAEALRAARAAGITVVLDGEALLLEAEAEPPWALLDALLRHKQAILDLLRPEQCGWTTDQWRAYFHERRMIAVSSGGLSRVAAKNLALKCCVVEWLNQHPVLSEPGYCAWCGETETAGAVVLPFGTEPGLHTWLHAECWTGWYRARRNEALAALGAMGIDAEFPDDFGKNRGS